MRDSMSIATTAYLLGRGHTCVKCDHSNIPCDPKCDCGHAHFDHSGTNGGKCLKCICLAFRRTAP
jgi:hypothetical protein